MYSNRAAYCELRGEICVSRSRLINAENSGMIQREWAIFFWPCSQSREIRKVPRVPRFYRYSRATREYFMEIINYTARAECSDGSRPPRIASNFWRTIDVSRHFLATATAENAKFQSHSNNYSRSIFDARDTVNSRNKIVVNCRQWSVQLCKLFEFSFFVLLFLHLPNKCMMSPSRRCVEVVEHERMWFFCFEYFKYMHICTYTIFFRLGFPFLSVSNVTRRM